MPPFSRCNYVDFHCHVSVQGMPRCSHVPLLRSSQFIFCYQRVCTSCECIEARLNGHIPPSPRLVRSGSMLCVCAEATRNTAHCDWTTATSPGAVTHKTRVLMWCATPPTTSWCGPRLWSRTVSSRLTPLHSRSGTRPTTVFPSGRGGDRPRWVWPCVGAC